MSDLLLIIVSMVLVNNFVLVQFLGLCPFMGVSNQLESSLGMALATTFVLTLASAISYLLYHYLLVPAQLEYLRIISCIFVIASVVQFTELMMRHINSLLHRLLGIFLPLITTNCAVLGVTLANLNQSRSFVESLCHGFGAALGFSLVLVLFAGLRERIVMEQVPEPFQGAAITMISAGLMSLGFMGFFAMA